MKCLCSLRILLWAVFAAASLSISALASDHPSSFQVDALTVPQNDDTFQLRIFFRLDSLPASGISHMLTISLGNRHIVYTLGSNGLHPDGEGFFSICICDISKAELETAGGLTLTLSGATYIRESVPLIPGTESVSALVYDAADQQISPVEGAKLGLYVQCGGLYHLILSDLPSYPNGPTVVSGLNGNYCYAFRETEPPSGYDRHPAFFPVLHTEDTVQIPNFALDSNT